jgi:hypothetical protein
VGVGRFGWKKLDLVRHRLAQSVHAKMCFLVCVCSLFYRFVDISLFSCHVRGRNPTSRASSRTDTITQRRR